MTRCRQQICRVLLSAAETRDLPRAAAVRMDRGRRPRARDYIVGVVESAAAYTDQTVQFVAVGLTGRHNARPLSCWKVAITYASVVRQQPIEHNVITFPTPSVSAGARAAPGARPIHRSGHLAVLVALTTPTPPSVQLKTRRRVFARSAGHAYVRLKDAGEHMTACAD